MDLIDREKLQSTIRNMVEIPNEVRVQVLGAVSRAKAVDAKPVVHGEWVQIGYDKLMDRITCSHCEEYFNIVDNCTEAFNYCPNCGAKMDGGAEDGNL